MEGVCGDGGLFLFILFFDLPGNVWLAGAATSSIFVAAKLCCDKHVFVMTKVLLQQKYFVMTNIILSQQVLFVVTKAMLPQTHVCHTNFVVVATKMILVAGPAKGRNVALCNDVC